MCGLNDKDKISEKKLIYGRYLNDSDVSENKNVVVIGEQIYKTLFEVGENPIGKSINIKGVFFNVIGVFSMKRRVGIESDQTAFIPLSTFTQMFNEGDKVGFLASSSVQTTSSSETTLISNFCWRFNSFFYFSF